MDLRNINLTRFTDCCKKDSTFGLKYKKIVIMRIILKFGLKFIMILKYHRLLSSN